MKSASPPLITSAKYFKNVLEKDLPSTWPPNGLINRDLDSNARILRMNAQILW